MSATMRFEQFLEHATDAASAELRRAVVQGDRYIDRRTAEELLYRGADPNYAPHFTWHWTNVYGDDGLPTTFSSDITYAESPAVTILDSAGAHGLFDVAIALIDAGAAVDPKKEYVPAHLALMKHARELREHVKTTRPGNDYIAEVRSKLSYDRELRDSLTKNSTIGGPKMSTLSDSELHGPLSHSDTIHVKPGTANHMAAVDALVTSLENRGLRKTFSFEGWDETDPEQAGLVSRLSRVLIGSGQHVQ